VGKLAGPVQQLRHGRAAQIDLIWTVQHSLDWRNLEFDVVHYPAPTTTRLRRLCVIIDWQPEGVGQRRLPSMNSPTLLSTSGSSPVALANSSASPEPRAHGARPMAVATR